MARRLGEPRPRRPRRLGRRILLALALAAGLWYGYDTLLSTSGSPAAPPAGVVGTDAGDMPAVARQPRLGDGSDSRPSADPRGRVRTGDTERRTGDSLLVTRNSEHAGLFDRIGSWFDGAINRALSVREIEVRGGAALPNETIAARLDTLAGSPMLEIDPPAIAAVLRDVPRLRRVEVGRRLPGTVTVTVEERREIALLVAGEAVYGVDADAVALPVPDHGWPLDLPVISGHRGEIEPGRRIDSPGVRRALAWIAHASRTPRVHAWISELRLDGDSLAWIAGADGRTLLPGEHHPVAQLATLDAFLASAGAAAGGRIIDLTFPEFLIVREEAG
ncbi:MAG: Cell division protein FtsQ [Calditrichaeota bacterium]|nr:Cell division protein FtsQ [Calditrichota bacterium]